MTGKTDAPATTTFDRRRLGQDEALRGAWQRLENGEYEAALTEFEQRLRERPSEAVAFYGAGASLLMLQRPAEAIGRLEVATQLDAGWPLPLYLWGLALSALDREEEAVRKYEECFALAPKDPALHKSWGASLAVLDRPLEAIDHFQVASQLKPGDFEIHDRWARALNALDRNDEAIDQFKRAADLNPVAAHVQFGWALVLRIMSRFEESLERYEEAIRLEPGTADFQYGAGMCLASLDRIPEAIERLERATELAPGHVEAHHRWGLLLAQQGDHENALRRIDRALALDATIADIHDSRARSLVSLGRISEADATLARATSIDPAFGSAFLLWANVLRKDRRFADAWPKYERATELMPENAQALIDWADALSAAGDDVAALAKCELADRMESVDRFQLLLSWAISLDRVGQRERAAEKWRDAEKASPESPIAPYGLGVSLAGARRFEEALECFERATRLKAEPEHFIAWANALSELGQFDRAIEMAQRAIELDPDSAYAHHNIGHFYWTQGDYARGMPAWEDAARAYQREAARALKDRNAMFFENYGRILHQLLGDSPGAEQMLLRSRELDAELPGALTALGDIYAERAQRPWHGDDLTALGSWVREHRRCYGTAERLLRSQLATVTTWDKLLHLGSVLLELQRDDEALEVLKHAHALAPHEPDVCVHLGVARMRHDDHRGAMELFRRVHAMQPYNLNAKTNLAEALMALKRINDAERLFREALAVAERNIDANVGMAEVCTAMAEAGETDQFKTAMTYYGTAIRLANANAGSKRILPKDLAAIHYMRGYVSVKAYEATEGLRDPMLLLDAYADFEKCCILDPTHHKGARAREKVRARRAVLSSGSFATKVAPFIILVPAIFMVIAAQIEYFFATPAPGPTQYLAVTITGMLFVVIGMFLPQINRLKGAGIEIEKSPVSQVAASAGLGITK